MNEFYDDLYEEEIHESATRQTDKYGKGFRADLDQSQVLVNLGGDIFHNRGLTVQSQVDVAPFMTSQDGEVRLYDQHVMNSRLKIDCYVEYKDFPQCIFYPLTGLPKRYVDKMIELVDIDRLIIVFSDCNKYIKNWCEIKPYNSFFCRAWNKEKTRENLIQEMEEKGFAKRKPDGNVDFIPYGNFLPVLMENIGSSKNPVLCKWKKFEGEEQYLWKMEVMKPIPVLVEEMIKGKQKR